MHQHENGLISQSFSKSHEKNLTFPFSSCLIKVFLMEKEVFCKKVFLEISQKSRENTCTRVSFVIKLEASGLQLYLKGDWHRYFPVNFAKFLSTSFLTECLQWLPQSCTPFYCFHKVSLSKWLYQTLNLLYLLYSSDKKILEISEFQDILYDVSRFFFLK